MILSIVFRFNRYGIENMMKSMMMNQFTFQR